MNRQIQALNLDLRADLYDWLKAKAEDDRRTLKATLELILENAQRKEQGA